MSSITSVGGAAAPLGAVNTEDKDALISTGASDNMAPLDFGGVGVPGQRNVKKNWAKRRSRDDARGKGMRKKAKAHKSCA
jgi:hypothetical protein